MYFTKMKRVFKQSIIRYINEPRYLAESYLTLAIRLRLSLLYN